jgi:hypothetical protein
MFKTAHRAVVLDAFLVACTTNTTSTGLRVTASIVAATLGEECGGSGYCPQSNVQIAFNAGPGSQAARIEIVRVDLVNAAGSVLDTLKASKPQLWNGGGYSPWDQTMKPETDAMIRYDLTAPAWSTLDGSRTAYFAKHKLHVTLLIDGVQITLESATLSRETAVMT